MSASGTTSARHWFVLTQNGERGPYSTTAMKRFAWQGHIRRATQVRLEHGPWFEAGRIGGLWDVRWRRPNGQLVADGQAAAPPKPSPPITASTTAVFSWLHAAKTRLTKSCVFATCSDGGETN